MWHGTVTHYQFINALVQKRADVSGIIADFKERTRQARLDLAHLDATPKSFDPDAKPDEIGIKRVANRNGWFASGEMSRRIRESLRVTTEPLSCDELVRAAMIDKGLDPDDKAIRQQIRRSFLWTLHRMQVNRNLKKVGYGVGARWALPEG